LENRIPADYALCVASATTQRTATASSSSATTTTFSHARAHVSGATIPASINTSSSHSVAACKRGDAACAVIFVVRVGGSKRYRKRGNVRNLAQRGRRCRIKRGAVFRIDILVRFVHRRLQLRLGVGFGPPDDPKGRRAAKQGTGAVCQFQSQRRAQS